MNLLQAYRYKCMHQKVIMEKILFNKSKLYHGFPIGRGHVERKMNHLEALKQKLDKMHVVGPHQPET